MRSACTHTVTERDVAAEADGLCALCLAQRLGFITDVLEMLDSDSEYGDLDESVFKLVRDREIIFMVNANDLFYWATADGEEITPENLPVLKQAVRDVRAAFGVTDEPAPSLRSEPWDRWYHAGSRGATLFCCRVRGMRPQRPCYEHIPTELHALYDACGPVRDRRDEG